MKTYQSVILVIEYAIVITLVIHGIVRIVRDVITLKRG